MPDGLAGLEPRHREHARVEDRIRQAKNTGLRNLPCHRFDANAARFEGGGRSVRRRRPIGSKAAADRFEELTRVNDLFRRDYHELAEHLELALASIQRLALQNDHLHRQLEARHR